jgi:endonuclease YncB( thermonuclease family)
MRPPIPALLCAISLTTPAWGDCPEPPRTAQARVAHVIDGDTLVLADGRRLRLIGIDTPELGREGGTDQPFAVKARKELLDSIGRGRGLVRLLLGIETRDRHGRSLAHVYDASGHNLNEHLLRRGLAAVSSFPPNLRFADCYRQAEAAARRARAGLWRLPPTEAHALTPQARGFRRVRGRVHAVGQTGDGLRITLEGGLELRVKGQDQVYFDQDFLKGLPGRSVEVRGWLYRYRGEPRMRLRHPSAFVEPQPPL